MKSYIFKPSTPLIDKWYSMDLKAGCIYSMTPVQVWWTPEMRRHWSELEGAKIVAELNRKAMSGTSIPDLAKSRLHSISHSRRTAEAQARIAKEAATLRTSQVRRGLNPDEMKPLSTIVMDKIRASNEERHKQVEATYRHSDEYKLRRKLEFRLKESDPGITQTELDIEWELLQLEPQFWNKEERLRKQAVLDKLHARRLGK